MYTKILAISSILLGLFIIFNIYRTTDFPAYFQYKDQYHMGCFSTENTLDHSTQMKNYLNTIQAESQLNLPQKQSFQLSKRIDLKHISLGVARDFEKYLSQYYQIKTKNIYQQNFYKSLSVAQQKFQTKKQQLSKKFNKEQCLSSWNNLDLSRQKYDNLKNVLRQKIQKKQEQERKVSYMILNNNYVNEEQYQKNITDQINVLNSQRQNINGQKIQIFKQKAPLERFISSNKTKLEIDQKQLDDCVKNFKIIKYCNELNEQLSMIKISFTKQDLQTKIQRKRMIIDSFHNAIKNAQKIGDRSLIESNKQNLKQNQQELILLQARIQDFKTFEESYCSKCSDTKIQELRQTIRVTKILIDDHTIQLRSLQNQQQDLDKRLAKISLDIQNLQKSRDQFINSNLCDTPQCQQKRSRDLKQLGRVLSQMKKDVIDYRWTLQQHKIQHEGKEQVMNNWHNALSQVIGCLYDKQYYQNLKQRKPEHNENEVIKMKRVRDQLVRNLQALAP